MPIFAAFLIPKFSLRFLGQNNGSAKTEAFLSVALFAKVFEKYKGSTIPPKVGMRNLLSQEYGLAPDRLDPAVRVLFESAEQAGFFPSGDQTRLIRPTTRSAGQVQNPPEPSQYREPPENPVRGGGGGDGGPPGVHTAIVGLLRELPPPGSAWPKRSKDRFIKAFLATLDFVYIDDSEEEASK